MSEELVFLAVFSAVVLLGPTMLIGHMEFKLGQRRDYPHNPGEPGIRYVLRSGGIMLYYGLVDWKDMIVGGITAIATTLYWLVFGENVEENNGE